MFLQWKLAIVAIIGPALLCCKSQSKGPVQLSESLQVMEEKFGAFDFEELDQYLYSVDISMQPIVAVASESILYSPPGQNAEERREENVWAEEGKDGRRAGYVNDAGHSDSFSETTDSGGLSVNEDLLQEDIPNKGAQHELKTSGSHDDPEYEDTLDTDDTPQSNGASPDSDIYHEENSQTLLGGIDQQAYPDQAVKAEMISTQGQKYQCNIPNLTPMKQASVNSSRFPNVSQVVDSLQHKPCLTKSMGWWTYEYCHGKFVKQYHLEAGKVVGETIYLGHFSNQTEWNETMIAKVTDLVQSVRDNLPYEGQAVVFHSVYYDNGTVCDLTDTPRRTWVKMMCGMSGEDKLSSVEEVETCNYVLHLYTPLLCALPLFNQVQRNKQSVIKCSPLVSEQTYRDYIKMKDESVEKEARAATSKHFDGVNSQIGSTGGATSTSLFGEHSESQDDLSTLNLALLKMLEHMLAPEKKVDKELAKRRQLLEKLIRKVQPEFSDVEVEEKAQEMLQKDNYKNFDLEFLRELIEGGKDDRSLTEEGGGIVKEKEVGQSEDDEDVWDQLSELDNEALAEVEAEVSAELRKKLAEMGLPTEGDVKFKVIKLSDVEFVDEEDEVENAEGVPREGDSSSTKENKVRIMRMGSLTNHDYSGTKFSKHVSAERKRVSDLEAGYRSLWEDKKPDHDKKKK